MGAKKLVFSGEIGNELVEKVWKGNWSELILCSEGGCIYADRAVCDYLLKHEKKVIGVGAIMSAATPIIVCGSPAVCSSEVTFMAHFSSAQDTGGRAHEMKNHAEELDRWDKWSLELLSQRTGTSKEQWKDLMEQECHFGAKVALELGLIDEIL